MQARPTSLLDALSNRNVTFFIPPYQRNYEWTTDNCKVLLEDIERTAEANLANIHTEHFFGSIVYVVEDAGFGIPAKYILTDGQQRITTTMLFMMALRDSITDSDYQSEIQRNYLENDRADESVEYKIKLKQVETDWQAYKHLVLRDDMPTAMKTSSVYQNYQFFLKELKARDDDSKKALLEKGLMRFSVISIQLEPDRNPWENPQEIFESMNSLGKPLSLADLVRNYLLMGKNADQQTNLYNNSWLTLEQRLPGKLSEFIRDWMQADQHKSFNVASENNFKKLYGEFKGIAAARPVEALFNSFVRFSLPYAIVCGLEKTGISQLDQVLADLNIIGVKPAYSYLTELLEKWKEGLVSDKEIIGILIALRTYLLRRRLLGLTTAENKFYPVLGKRLDELIRSEDTVATFFQQLSSQEYALRLPNDSEVTAIFDTLNFYNLGRSHNYPRLLLVMAEEHLTKSRPRWDDPYLQIEHIMPQTLNKAWIEELGPDAEVHHQELVNNIGNITLIRHNQELGNKPFREKRRIYTSHSGLQISQNQIISKETWDEDAILERQNYLVRFIIEDILAVPQQFRQTSNWNSKARKAAYSQQEILNRLIGETIEYAFNPSFTAVVTSDSQVLFEGKYWALGPLTGKIKERSGANVSSNSNFHGPSNWNWGGTRLTDLEF